MKIIAVLAGAILLIATLGCQETHQQQGAYGGSLDGEYQSYGHGEYLGYPDYPQYRQQR